MRRMENKDIHAINLELLKHIDAFCRDRNIVYFLDSGTLLGAARDGDFIPWDDDADIAMPRPDYERFVEEYVDSTNYRLYAPARGNCFLPYARLCEMKRTYFKQVSPWTKESPGVGVDIFPIDGAPDSAEVFDMHADKIVKIRNQLWDLRFDMRKQENAFRRTPIGFIKDCVHFVAFKVRKVLNPIRIRRKLDEIRKLRLEYPYEAAANCCYIVVKSGRSRFWRKEWFSDKEYMSLCGEEFPVPTGWDARLTAAYGDWRNPPPESERIGHVSAQTMYWRDK